MVLRSPFRIHGQFYYLELSFTENMNERLRELLDKTNSMANFERSQQRVIYCFNKHVLYSITEHLTSNK